MTITDWTTLIASLLAFILGIINLVSRAPTMNMVDRGQYLKSVNEAIGLANARALEAEQRVVDLESKLKKLENDMRVLEDSMFYKISFYATLGANPVVEHVEIAHHKERRVRDDPVKIERRKS